MLLKGNFMYDPLIKVPLVVKFPAASVEAVQESVDAQRLVNIIDASATVGFGPLLLPRL